MTDPTGRPRPICYPAPGSRVALGVSPTYPDLPPRAAVQSGADLPGSTAAVVTLPCGALRDSPAPGLSGYPALQGDGHVTALGSSGGPGCAALRCHGPPRMTATRSWVGRWIQAGPPECGGDAGRDVQQRRVTRTRGWPRQTPGGKAKTQATAKKKKALEQPAQALPPPPQPYSSSQNTHPTHVTGSPCWLIRSLREDARLAKTLVGRGRVFI